MIWTGDEAIDASDVSENPLGRSISAVCESAALDPVHAEEVSLGITAFLREQAVEGENHSVDFARLTAHVLHHIGEEEASRCVLVVNAGVTRVDSWMVAGDVPVIVLDIFELVSGKGACLEAGLFNSLNAVLMALQRVGQQYSEGFRVGLRGVQQSASLILGDAAPACAVQSLSKEVVEHCRARLTGDAGDTEAPVVFSLDME